MSIGDWLETPSGGKISGYVFGFGASVVIIGALFKIMHWPGASVVLTAGMATEAVLFVVTAFGKPHKSYNWETLFPELMHEPQDMEEQVNLTGAIKGIGGVGGGVSGSGLASVAGSSATGVVGGNIVGAASAMAELPGLSEEDVEKLSKGISNLSATADSLSKLAKAGESAEALSDNIISASIAAAAYASAQNEINTSASALVDSYKGIASTMSSASQTSGNFINIMSDVNKNLSAVSSAYELQVNAINAVSADVTTYKNASVKLAQQVSDLNNVYGNMLNALSVNA